jgi:hypothetical protein
MFTCLGCGEEAGGRRARLYCSNACQSLARQRVLVAAWLETGTASLAGSRDHYVKRHILAEQGGTCSLCELEQEWQGRPLVFVLDHVDGDAENNRRENLRMVCPNCDSQLPTYKSRNRGRGRHARRQRYADGRSY